MHSRPGREPSPDNARWRREPHSANAPTHRRLQLRLGVRHCSTKSISECRGPWLLRILALCDDTEPRLAGILVETLGRFGPAEAALAMQIACRVEVGPNASRSPASASSQAEDTGSSSSGCGHFRP